MSYCTYISTTRLINSGALECSCILNGQLIRRTYFGYTVSEAKAMFREVLRSL